LDIPVSSNPHIGFSAEKEWLAARKQVPDRTAPTDRTVFHFEDGKTNRPPVVKFQLRPDPLAK
jgi:hypothetical protein